MGQHSRPEEKWTVSRTLRLGVPAILTASLLISSANATAHTGRTASSTPVRCKHRNPASGTITVADNFFDPNLSPYSPTGSPSTFPLLFDDLFRFDGKSRLFPMMAAAVPTLKDGGIRDGGKTIIIHVKKGLRWSNGSEITSADVKFGWQVATDPASGPYCGGACDVVVRIDVPDRYTVVLHLKRVFPPLLSPSINLVGYMWNVWPTRWPGAWSGDPHAAAVKLAQDPSFTFNGPGYPTNGPYQVVRDGAAGVVFRPMPYYDDMSCGGYLRQIVYRGYPSAAAQVAAAASGGMDVGVGYFPSDLPDLLLHTGAYKVYVQPTFSFEHLVFNLDQTYSGQLNPLFDVRVRQALALALDKRVVIEHALSVPAHTASQILAWSPWVNTRALQQPYADPEITGQWDPIARRFDPNTGTGRALADARKLLAETRWKHGLSLDFYTSNKPGRTTVMADVAAQWARIGVKVHQFVISGEALLTDWAHGGALVHGAFQVALFGEVGGPDPDGLALLMETRHVDRDSSVHSPSANVNFAGIRDRTIDRAFEQAIHTVSRSLRRTNFWIIQRRLNEQAYWIPIYYVPDISTADRRVLGFQPNSAAAISTWNVYAWKVRGS
jgi:peptide/nickel transport system substrate-binding protein